MCMTNNLLFIIFKLYKLILEMYNLSIHILQNIYVFVIESQGYLNLLYIVTNYLFK